jgi:hypothetical protein
VSSAVDVDILVILDVSFEELLVEVAAVDAVDVVAEVAAHVANII